MANPIWEKAISAQGLKAGWHLTRVELRAAFFFDYFHQQAFAQSLDRQVDEARRLLTHQNYRTRPLRKVQAPKGPLGTRPGSHIPIRDRMIFWALVKEIAPIFEDKLSKNVYSYRLKKNPKRGELFKEGNALSIPFLKKRQISIELDPFEAWYNAWPDFEERSRSDIDLGYNYLVVSDIAAYFENINIDVLREQLLTNLPGEPILCNFIAEGLAEWVNTSYYGSRPKRGIPQGTGISSFFGNIYLAPIDENFDKFSKNEDINYIRYMDDIRIFCKDLATARKCVFGLEQCVRALHLNLQTAKTKILEEKANDKQITDSLFDDRVETLGELRELHEKGKIDDQALGARLKQVARSEPKNRKSSKLHLVKNPKSDLTDRAMRAWMNLSIRCNDQYYIQTLIRQYYTNPDTRLSRIFVNTCRTFPKTRSLGNSVVDFVDSELNIHQEHEAELLCGCRYLSTIDETLWKRALENVFNFENSFQLRVQSILLLSMRSHSNAIYKKLFLGMKRDPDAIVQPYYFSVLGQLGHPERESLIEFFMHNPNPHNHEFGMLLSGLNTDRHMTRRILDYIFQSDVQIIDWQGALFFMARAEDKAVTAILIDFIRERLKSGGRSHLRNRLAAIRNVAVAHVNT